MVKIAPDENKGWQFGCGAGEGRDVNVELGHLFEVR